jgi:hypothetical protein
MQTIKVITDAVELCLWFGHMCADKDEWAVWAAWAQGLGSVLAIGIAIYVVHRQVRAASELEKSRQLQKLEAVGAIAVQASVRINEALDALRSDAHLRGYIDEGPGVTIFRYIEQGLSNVPLHDVPDATVIAHVWALIDALDRTKRLVEVAHQELSMSDSYGSDAGFDKDGIEDVVSELRRHTEIAISSIESAVNDARESNRRSLR